MCDRSCGFHRIGIHDPDCPRRPGGPIDVLRHPRFVHALFDAQRKRDAERKARPPPVLP